MPNHCMTGRVMVRMALDTWLWGLGTRLGDHKILVFQDLLTVCTIFSIGVKIMGGPKKKTKIDNYTQTDWNIIMAGRDPQYRSYVDSIKNDSSLSAAEKADFLTLGDSFLSPASQAAASLYYSENKMNPVFGSDGKLAIPDVFKAQGATGEANATTQLTYLKKAYDKLKKEKQMVQDKQKLLTDQPGLSAQTGKTALAMPGPTTALGGY